MKILETVFEYKLSGGERLAWHTRYHRHGLGQFELHFFLEGAGVFLNNGKQFPIARASLMLSGPHEFHAIVPQKNSGTEKKLLPSAQAPSIKSLSYYAILFQLAPRENELLNMLSNSCKNNTPKKLETRYHFIFDELRHLSTQNGTSYTKAAEHHLLAFLYTQYSEHGSEQVSSATSSYVEDALDFMKKNIQTNLSIASMAQHLKISEEHFIRIFKEKTQLSPHQYFLHLKIEEATKTLSTSAKSIGAIADALGFENQFHFSRVFKKCTGLTPSSYRLQKKR